MSMKIMQTAEQPLSTRSSQACRHCRNIKARCLPSSEPGTCQRCMGLKRECSWPALRPRAKRARTSTSRISNVEEKLDGLVALLGDGRHEKSSTLPARAAQPTPSRSVHHESPAPADPESPGNEAGMPESDAETQQTPEQTMTDDSMLSEFRTLSSFFPFVYLPPTTSTPTLRERRPFVFQAIQLITSSGLRPVQVALEEQFRRAIVEAVFLESQKNLDVLQGLELYLAWYHFHFKPQSQQIYQLLGLAVSMVIDLGYHSPRRRARIDISGSSSDGPTGSAEERETQRAYLGCYYLASAFAGALSRPPLLKYTDYMTTCAERLQRDAETTEDITLPHIIKLCNLGEQMSDLLGSAEHSSSPRTQMHVDMFKNRIREWRQQIPSAQCSIGIQLAHHFAVLELYSTGLNSDWGREPLLAPLEKTSFTNNMYSCLDAGKSFLDTCLACSLDQYRTFSFVEWMRLPIVLLSIAKLSFENDRFTAAGWDPQAARSHVRLDLYLESLCYRMQSLTTFEPPTQTHPDFFLSFKMILERTRQWYGRRTKSLPPANGSSVINDSICLDDSPLERIRDPHGTPLSTSSAPKTVSPPTAVYQSEGSGCLSQVFDLSVNGQNLLPDFNGMDDPGTFMSNDFWDSLLYGNADAGLGL